ncbi:MAG: c-type cytochrome [Leptospirales bacterium]|jgi:cytochrome c oxidase cbb3-type subunit 3
MGRVPVLRTILLSLLIGATAMPGTALAASAKDNYRTYCAQCHGLQGNGRGVNIRDMSVQPRNHTDAEYMSTRSDQDLFTADQKGGLAIDKSVLMPPWGDTLTSAEIRDMVQYLRTLCHCKNNAQ